MLDEERIQLNKKEVTIADNKIETICTVCRELVYINNSEKICINCLNK